MGLTSPEHWSAPGCSGGSGPEACPAEAGRGPAEAGAAVAVTRLAAEAASELAEAAAAEAVGRPAAEAAGRGDGEPAGPTVLETILILFFFLGSRECCRSEDRRRLPGRDVVAWEVVSQER